MLFYVQIQAFLNYPRVTSFLSLVGFAQVWRISLTPQLSSTALLEVWPSAPTSTHVALRVPPATWYYQSPWLFILGSCHVFFKKRIIKKKRVWHSGNCSITNMLCNHISLKNRCIFLIMKNILLPPYGTTNDSPTDLSGSILSWPYVTVLRNGWVIHARHILVYQLKLLEVCMICVSVIKPC